MDSVRQEPYFVRLALRAASRLSGDWLHRAVVLPELWIRRSRERRELGQLDARLLRDIGLRREDALAIARKPFWRE